MGRPVSLAWRELVLEACSRKSLTLLESIEFPRKFDRILVACKHHPEGRRILVKNIISSFHCCHAGNAQSVKGRQQRSATLSSMWDDPQKKNPLLRNGSGHKGPEKTKLYICKILTKNGLPVLKFGRSIRGAKRYGSFLAEELWELEVDSAKARLVELYAHLRFSEYSLENVELNTSGYTECYSDSLPIEDVIAFIKQSL